MLRIILLAVSLFATTSISAAEQDKLANIERLLEVTNSEEIVKSILGQTEQMMSNMGAQIGVRPNEEEYFSNFSEKVFDLLTNEMNWDTLKTDFIELYSQNFTEKEIADMLSFYETDSGRAMVEKMPLVLQESIQLSQNRMMSIMPDIQEMARELQQELEQVRSSQ